MIFRETFLISLKKKIHSNSKPAVAGKTRGKGQMKVEGGRTQKRQQN